MAKQHHYRVELEWTGNLGTGTSAYAAFSRNHILSAPGQGPIAGSSDPKFRGDPACWNPEQLLVASLASCHQLWYLHLCSDAGVIVTAYTDAAEGRMEEQPDGAGQFTEVTLKPHVTIAPGSDPARALALHADAAAKCFIARSMAFPVHHAPRITMAEG